MVQLVKAHMQEENEQLILNDVEAADVTNEDYDQIVQLPVNNQSRLIENSRREFENPRKSFLL